MAKATTEIRSLARSHTESAIKALSSIMSSTKAPPAARVSAAIAILDRGWGRPTQMIAADPENPPFVMTEKMSDRDLARRIALMLHDADPKNRAKDDARPQAEPVTAAEPCTPESDDATDDTRIPLTGRDQIVTRRKARPAVRHKR